MTVDLSVAASILPDKSGIDSSTLPTLRPTSILHRTPWRPPVAISAEGVWIELEDGRRVLDGVGGAAVTCIGNGHPTVIKALKDQVDRLSCMSPIRVINPVSVEMKLLLFRRV